MKYLSIYTPARQSAMPPPREEMQAMGKFMAESIKNGSLISTGGLLPVSQGGAVVRQSRSEVTVTDGPFTEAKEMIVGWAILQANSREEVLAMTRRFLNIAGDGECELRQIMEEGGCSPQQ